MTEKIKEFLEAVSADEEFIGRLKKAGTAEEVIALAAEKGFSLTAADLGPGPVSDELSEDELDAVAGGEICGCAGVGFGGQTGIAHDCICYLYGDGKYGSNNINGDAPLRCLCIAGGGGEDHPI